MEKNSGSSSLHFATEGWLVCGCHQSLNCLADTNQICRNLSFLFWPLINLQRKIEEMLSKVAPNVRVTWLKRNCPNILNLAPPPPPPPTKINSAIYYMNNAVFSDFARVFEGRWILNSPGKK